MMRFGSLLLLSAMSVSSVVCAAENTVEEAQSKNLEISIYNNNLALVKDSRDVRLLEGDNNVAFEGVATQIKPESVIISGEGVNVLEQNYDYDLLTAQNIIDKSIGEEVKTVVENPTTGENIFDKAKVISANYGSPILEFAYGIEVNFPGRLVFEKLPQSLRSKPTLEAKISSTSSAVKELFLAYLTNGISWKTNYVAKVANAQTLDLTGWVTINNQSGTDYTNARVQLIAGDVNQVVTGGGPILARNTRLMAEATTKQFAVDTGAVASQAISGYHLYTLPNKTNIKENQTKQISLMEKSAVKYAKEGRLYSQLYFNGDNQSSFEKQHPALYYVMRNSESDNLGLPLPSGVIRFYENDKDGNLQFIGENSIGHVAKGEKIELNIGKLFNVFVDGEIVKVSKVSENKTTKLQNGCWTAKIVRNYEVAIDFHNGGNVNEEVVFTQNLNQNSKVIKENLAGKAKNINTYEWRVTIPAEGETKLTYTAEVTSDERLCD